MPSVSSLLPDDKSRIKRSIPSGNKILTATVARIYYQKGHEWDYSGIQGGLCLVVDKQRGGVWWKVVDLLGTRGIIWEHELPNSSTWSYNQDRGFFHSFPSEETNVAFVFADESEAGEMYKKVQGRGKYSKSAKAAAAPAASPSSSKKKKKGGPIDKSQISGPSEGSFKHLAHMGYTSELGFSSSGVDPSWQQLLDSLGNKGISTKQIMENEGFIKDFVQKQGGPPPVQPKKRTPPPAPTSKRKAPPPPPSRSATTAAPSSSSVPPPPPLRQHAPPPPARPSYTPPPQEDYYEPPPPARVVPPPPQRPAAPALPGRGAAPPPPPPPPGRPAPPALPGRGGAPPPPPPPPARDGGHAPPALGPPVDDLPQVTPPRANLLASIQGAGLHKLKSSSSSSSSAPSHVPPSPPPSSSHGTTAAAVAGGAVLGAGAGAVVADDAGGAGDLASALASALSQRKGNMGDSDEEDSDDEWD